MTADKLVWVRCQDWMTERKVRKVFEENQHIIPQDLGFIFSYGREIEMMHPQKFLDVLENLVDDFKTMMEKSADNEESKG